jgi:hypothetical protein
VKRLGGLLPPLGFVRKEIAGSSGRTLVGPVSLRFDVRGTRLHYRAPLNGLVDVIESTEDDARRGRAELFGLRIGSFLLVRR